MILFQLFLKLSNQWICLLIFLFKDNSVRKRKQAFHFWDNFLTWSSTIQKWNDWDKVSGIIYSSRYKEWQITGLRLLTFPLIMISFGKVESWTKVDNSSVQIHWDKLKLCRQTFTACLLVRSISKMYNKKNRSPRPWKGCDPLKLPHNCLHYPLSSVSVGLIGSC